MNLLTLLKSTPEARERANKNKALAKLMVDRYKLEVGGRTMTKVVGDILTEDRKWRKLLEDNPELRGSDYDDKEILEQEKQVELGYGNCGKVKV